MLLAYSLLFQLTIINKKVKRRSSGMLKLIEQFDRMMVAVTFAEANAHGIALNILQERQKNARRKKELPIRQNREVRPQMRV